MGPVAFTSHGDFRDDGPLQVVLARCSRHPGDRHLCTTNKLTLRQMNTSYLFMLFGGLSFIDQ